MPDTIRDMRLAGIKTWVLTGDKVETAINIGRSAKLIDPSMKLITFRNSSRATFATIVSIEVITVASYGFKASYSSY